MFGEMVVFNGILCAQQTFSVYMFDGLKIMVLFFPKGHLSQSVEALKVHGRPKKVIT